jgi:putative aldouronate transport system permease protein
MLRKTSPARMAFLVVNTIVLGLITLLCFYPFWYILVYSLSDATKAQAGVTFWFKGFSLNNFVKVMELKGIGSAVFVSVARTLLGTLLTVFACTFMGYLFTKEEMPARKFIYRALIITMYVGGGLIPTYLTISAYKLVNTFWVYVVPSVVSAYNVILVKTFVEQLPASLEESAVLDGAGAFTVYRWIILPLSKPIVATIATFTAVGHWNSYMDNYLYVSKSSLNTLQYLLYKFLNSTQELTKMLQQGDTSAIHQMEAVTREILTPMGVRMTITVITILPIFLVYPFMQKYFSKGIMIGAVKG